MDNRLQLYINTAIKMKPCQIIARVKRKLGLRNAIGVQPGSMPDQLFPFESIDELDFDPVFLARFNADEFINGRVTFLYETEQFNWKGVWDVAERTQLWNFNLHYFEFLMAYVKAYQETHERKYLKAIETCIDGWIENNPVSRGGNGWAAYTISLRIVYWFSCLFCLSDELDSTFKERMIASLYEQYIYLANHLERDLLANHYFENLKALILCSIAFSDKKMLEKALQEFRRQCKEQILPDGMHFELSPMYHKIILEALLRVAVALRSANKADNRIESCIQSMLDVAYTFEEGLERIPLFNDGGNNVAKSLDSLLNTANKRFGLTPEYKNQLHDSGYYLYKWNDWKLIVDAGATGPKYNAGHAHCDAMSFELFYQGKPVVANCGTYAYQCKERAFFRSTAAHNTVMIEGVEQSQCWSNFRVGTESEIVKIHAAKDQIDIQMRDQKKTIINRTISFSDNEIREANNLISYLHLLDCKYQVFFDH